MVLCNLSKVPANHLLRPEFSRVCYLMISAAIGRCCKHICIYVTGSTSGQHLLADQALQLWCAKCPAAVVAVCCLALYVVRCAAAANLVAYHRSTFQHYRQLLRVCS